MTAPALRLAAPLAAGAAIAQIFPNAAATAAVVAAVVAAIAFALLAITTRTPQRRLAARPWWSIPIALLAAAIGMAASCLHQPGTLDLKQVNHHIATMEVEDLRRHDFGMSIEARLLTIDRNTAAGSHRVLVTTRGVDYTLMPGATIALRLDLAPIQSLSGPDQHNRAAAMQRRGIVYSQHIACHRLAVAPDSPRSTSWKAQLARWRWQVADRVMDTRTRATTQQLLLAMLLGDSRAVDSDLRQRFAQSGLAHVLALSGLHMAMVAALAWWLLLPLGWLRLPRLRRVLTIALMVVYAAFTGLSPSVVRATIMLSVAMASGLAERRTLPLNALGVAAMLILLVSPAQITSAGFQLSFLSVAALLAVPGTATAAQLRSWAWRLRAGLAASVMVAAVTMMVVACHFHVVTLSGLMANVVALPLLPVTMAAGAVLVFLSAVGLELEVVDAVADALCTATDGLATAAAGLTATWADGIWVPTAAAALHVAAAVMLLWWLNTRKRTTLMAMVVVLVAASVIMVADALTRPAAGIIVARDGARTAVMCHSGRRAVVWMPDTADSTTVMLHEFAQHHEAMLARRGVRQLVCIGAGDTLRDRLAVIRPPYALMHGMRLVAPRGRRWMHSETTATADVVLLTTHTAGSPRCAERLYAPRLVVAACDLAPDSTSQLHCTLLRLKPGDVASIECPPPSSPEL